jgi:hypothetical protein
MATLSAEREATVDCIARPKRRAEDAGCGEREVGALQREGSTAEKPLIRWGRLCGVLGYVSEPRATFNQGTPDDAPACEEI